MLQFFKISPRHRLEWVLDILGLLSQGLLVPILQTLVIAKLMAWSFPDFHGFFAVPGILAFLFSFVGVDYLYYWNHRMLHSKSLWPFHRVHHSIKRLDVLATSRNSVWTIFFIVYLWVQPVFVFLLKDPTWFIMGLVLGHSLDLWRHSSWKWNRDLKSVQVLRTFIIDPQDHEWHHSEEKFNVNFGANLNLWDRLHGTFHRSEKSPQVIGSELEESFWNQFVTPWRLK